ncbi:hypothetical protein A0J61_03021 [Choanephora cucurbitarum]|uniref:Uncharacterized protein n=1 Tax=Choanephora cucurbitarum TaxID=101091 RepID=A0A1C7NNS5_9FUNG|nr:hypothetical protein A0J61_03021 [Choanephora cucurbitarum]
MAIFNCIYNYTSAITFTLIIYVPVIKPRLKDIWYFTLAVSVLVLRQSCARMTLSMTDAQQAMAVRYPNPFPLRSVLSDMCPLKR